MKLFDVMQKLSSDDANWKRIQSEVSKASDKRARFIEIAKEQGLAVDAAELDATVAVAAASGGELNEGELQSVAGGLNFTSVSSNFFKYDSNQKVLIGLLLPAVQIKAF